MPTISNYLVTDDLTILLGLIGATVFLLQNLYKPQPLVHPILLGRQSDMARVRNPGESAVYRNYSTGLMGRVSYASVFEFKILTRGIKKFPLRPEKDINLVDELAREELDSPRTLWGSKVGALDA